jgi:hypothetical protein
MKVQVPASHDSLGTVQNSIAKVIGNKKHTRPVMVSAHC